MLEIGLLKKIGNCYMRKGTIIKITDKRKDITVNFGNLDQVFNNQGIAKDGSYWYPKKIVKLTDEIERMVEEKEIIRICKKQIEKAEINARQARQILEILNSEGEQE